MKTILITTLALLSIATVASGQTLKITHVRGNVYAVEDGFYAQENSAVYVGDKFVTVIGATWTPYTAELTTHEIAKITSKPIKQVINTNYNLDRAGGNAYFRGIGASVISIVLTRELLQREWTQMVKSTKEAFPDYPNVMLALPDQTYPGDFELQDGRVRGIYLGRSHTPDDIFVYFPEEKILYGGCILKEKLGNFQLADLDEYSRTLEKLKRLNLGFTTIIAGHYSPIHGPELVDQYLQLLALHRKQITGK
jgi:metallo-beta-lactamase class B